MIATFLPFFPQKITQISVSGQEIPTVEELDEVLSVRGAVCKTNPV